MRIKMPSAQSCCGFHQASSESRGTPEEVAGTAGPEAYLQGVVWLLQMYFKGGCDPELVSALGVESLALDTHCWLRSIMFPTPRLQSGS